jgi:hypothetical protein
MSNWWHGNPSDGGQWMRRRGVWFSVLGVMALLAGCGDSTSSDGDKSDAPPDYSSPEATFRTVCRAAGDSDFEAVLTCLTEESQTRLKRVCELGGELEQVTPEHGLRLSEDSMMKAMARDEAALEDIQTDGDTATARVVSKQPEAEDDTIRFAKVGGEWKIVLDITDDNIASMEAEVARALDLLKSKSDPAKE